MSIKTMRLARGWSQAQLAEFTGLSLRTVQRIEKGTKPTLETRKALAAVFEVDLDELEADDGRIDESALGEDELTELAHVRKTRRFIVQVLAYLVIVPLVCLAEWATEHALQYGLLLATGWGIWLAIRARSQLDLRDIFGADWEKRRLEKRLGRKIK